MKPLMALFEPDRHGFGISCVSSGAKMLLGFVISSAVPILSCWSVDVSMAEESPDIRIVCQMFFASGFCPMFSKLS